MLERSDDRLQRLWDNARYFRGRMQEAGFDTGRTETPITPVIIGDAAKAAELSRQLFTLGVFAQSIGFPTVPRGRARIRVMISAVHSREDLDFAVEQFIKAGRKLDLIQ